MIRRGLWTFLREAREAAQARMLEWRVVPSGSRTSALRAFQKACRDYPDCFNVLVVDSEGPVGASPRQHLRDRDGWSIEQPDEHCHLMVQMMAAWIIADREALRGFYGQGFQESAIPDSNDVEQVEKAALIPALTRASHNTQKGPYHKIRHAARLLERIDPALVRSKARHCERLFTTLGEVIAGGQ